jgi:RNA polymerase sigma-70 factor (ECF subfamily)
MGEGCDAICAYRLGGREGRIGGNRQGEMVIGESGAWVAPLRGECEDQLSEYIAGLRGGDGRAVRLAISILEPAMRRTLTRLLRSRGEVDDVLQESLWAFFRALPHFRGESTLLQFALRIARHQALTLLRRARRESARDGLFGLAQAVFVEPSRAPQDELLQRELAGRLARLCARLPAKQAEAVLLRFVFDYSVTEIAIETNTSLNTVRTRLRLGRAMLRRLLSLDAEQTI